MSSSKKIHCDTFFLSQPMFLILVGWKPCLGPTHINKYSIMCWDVLPPDEEFSFLLIFHKYSQILANIRSCAEMFSHQTKSLAWCCFFRELSYKLQTPSVWSNNENFLNRSRTFLVVFVSSVWFLFTPTNHDKVLKKHFILSSNIFQISYGRIYLSAFRLSRIRAMPIMGLV